MERRSPAPDAPQPLASHRTRGGGHRRLRVAALSPKKTINLGLDLQGGLHLVLGVDVDHAIGLAGVTGAGTPSRASWRRRGSAGHEDRAPRRERPRDPAPFSPAQWKDGQAAWSDMGTFDVKESDPAIGACHSLRSSPARSGGFRDLAVRQVLETIRNRVDQFGVAEPSIHEAGGQPDPRAARRRRAIPPRAKALIGKTAVLEFKLVDDRSRARAVRKGGLRRRDRYSRRVDQEPRRSARALRRPEEVLLTGGGSRTPPSACSTGSPGGAVRIGPVRQQWERAVRRWSTEENVGEGGWPSSSTATCTRRR